MNMLELAEAKSQLREKYNATLFQYFRLVTHPSAHLTEQYEDIKFTTQQKLVDLQSQYDRLLLGFTIDEGQLDHDILLGLTEQVEGKDPYRPSKPQQPVIREENSYSSFVGHCASHMSRLGR